MSKLLSILPFFYAQQTRYEWPRGFIHNAVTGWGAGLIATVMVCGQGFQWAAVHYFLGYLLFISIYEIGYLVNDTVSVRYEAFPRKRCRLEATPVVVTIFVALRLALIGSILAKIGSQLGVIYIISLALLVVTFALHNVLQAIELKIITFVQLSLYRFSLPVFPALILADKQQDLLMVLLVGFVLFTIPRLLTYLVAKRRLTLPEKRRREFLLLLHGCSLPILILVAFSYANMMPIALWLWLISAQLGYVLIGSNYAVLVTDPAQR